MPRNRKRSALDLFVEALVHPVRFRWAGRAWLPGPEPDTARFDERSGGRTDQRGL